MNWLEAVLLGCTPHSSAYQDLCCAPEPRGTFYECSLMRGHDGPHLAGTRDHLCRDENGVVYAWE